VKTGRKKEIESHHGAQESPVLRKGERQKEIRRERNGIYFETRMPHNANNDYLIWDMGREWNRV